jgi:hypothetical protein
MEASNIIDDNTNVEVVLKDQTFAVKYKHIKNDPELRVEISEPVCRLTLDATYNEVIYMDIFKVHRVRMMVKDVLKSSLMGNYDRTIRDIINLMCDDYPWVEDYYDALRHQWYRTFDYTSVIVTKDNKAEVDEVLESTKELRELVEGYEELNAESDYTRYFHLDNKLRPFNISDYYDYMTQDEFDQMISMVSIQCRSQIVAKVLSTYNMYHFGLKYIDEIGEVSKKMRISCITKLLYFMYKEEQIFKTYVTTEHRFVINYDMYLKIKELKIENLLPVLQHNARITRSLRQTKFNAQKISLDVVKLILDKDTVLTGSYLTAQIIDDDHASYGDIDIGVKCEVEDLGEIVEKKVMMLEAILGKVVVVKEKNKYQVKFGSTKFEFFSIFNEPISLVARFHVPPVRAYLIVDSIDTPKHQIYMLPSACFALATKICVDLRYFASTATPMAIIKKYMDRGFRFILSMYEMEALNRKYNKIQYDEYSGYVIAKGEIRRLSHPIVK